MPFAMGNQPDRHITGNLSRIADVLEVNVEYLMYGNDKRAAGEVRQGDELALLRLYRE